MMMGKYALAQQEEWMNDHYLLFPFFLPLSLPVSVEKMVRREKEKDS